MEREQLDADVVIVGAGPAGLACAIHLARLIASHNDGHRHPPLSVESIFLLEKAESLGMHTLSGAVIDPRGLAELLPGDEASGAPLDTPVREERLYWLTAGKAFRFPVLPSWLNNDGNYVVSLGKLAGWLGGHAEMLGVNVFTGFAGSELLFDGDRVTGVRTDDKGLDRAGKPKSNFQPGYDLKARLTVLAEGSRGSLSKQLMTRAELERDRNPQTYALGIKEIWRLPDGRLQPGTIWHSIGYPLGRDMYGGGWVYALDSNRCSLGLVTGLSYTNPRFSAHQAMQRFKQHPRLTGLLEGGSLAQYGAKTFPTGGYWAMPRPYADGVLLAGDSAGLLDTRRMKGVHLAIKSGMLAAETAFEALCLGDFNASTLSSYQQRIEASWIRDELWLARNHHQPYEHSLPAGMFHTLLQGVTGGRGLHARYPGTAGHESLRPGLTHGTGPEPPLSPEPAAPVQDRATSVFHSGVSHVEDQPVHLHIEEPGLCFTRCREEYGNPCQYFCPAGVYEVVEHTGKSQIRINAANCIHCKTCDIMDPYQIITWKPPEGGGGPRYEGM